MTIVREGCTPPNSKQAWLKELKESQLTIKWDKEQVPVTSEKVCTQSIVP